jgi:hypothetical protein
MKLRVLSQVLLISILFFSAAHAAAPYPVSITLKSNKNSYVLGEPVYLHMKIQNESDRPLKFGAVLNPTADLEIYLIQPNELPERYTSVFKPALYPQTVYELAPQEYKISEQTLLYNENAESGLLFDHPGKYTIDCRIAFQIDDRGAYKLYFPPINIEVNEPKESDKAAFQLINQKSIIFDLHTGLAKDENKAVFRKIVEQYPRSTYAPYALFALAGGEIFLQNPKQDYEKARSLYERLVADYEQFPQMDNVYYRVALCNDMLGNEHEALKWIVKIMTQYPDSSSIRHNDSLFQKYIYSKEEKLEPGTWMLMKREQVTTPSLTQ